MSIPESVSPRGSKTDCHTKPNKLKTDDNKLNKELNRKNNTIYRGK